MRNDDNDDDWTVNSSEHGDEPPNTFQYSVTVTVTPSDHGNEPQFETFDIEAHQGNEPAFASLCSSEHFPTVVVDPFTVDRSNDGTIIDFDSIKQDYVCLCLFDNVKDVNTVLRTAFADKAIAVLTVKRPTQLTVTELPVFVVSKEMMNKLKNLRNVTVSFQRFLCGVDRSTEGDETANLLNDKSIVQGQFGDANMDTASSVLEPSLASLTPPSEGCNDNVPAIASDSSNIFIDTSMADPPRAVPDSGPLVGCKSHPLAVSDKGVAGLRVSCSACNSSVC